MHWLFPLESEPEYEGRKLSDWLDRLVYERKGVGSQYTMGLSGAESCIAIRAMGTNVLPCLIRKMRAHDRAAGRLRGVLWRNQSIIKVKYVSAETLRRQAVEAIRCLGPAAESAIPELALLLGKQETAPYAARSLGAISPKAIPILLRGLNNDDPLIRREAAYGLGGGFAASEPWFPHRIPPRLGTNASMAIPALVRATKDTNDEVRAAAFYALGSIRQAPEIVLPTLQEGLRDSAAKCRSAVVEAFRMFGTNPCVTTQ